MPPQSRWVHPPPPTPHVQVEAMATRRNDADSIADAIVQRARDIRADVIALASHQCSVAKKVRSPTPSCVLCHCLLFQRHILACTAFALQLCTATAQLCAGAPGQREPPLPPPGRGSAYAGDKTATRPAAQALSCMALALQSPAPPAWRSS